MDKYQMIDGIIVLLDRVADARGIERCTLLAEIVNRADALKKGMRQEEDAKIKEIELLRKQIRDLTTPRPLKDGEIREGGETIQIDLTPD